MLFGRVRLYDVEGDTKLKKGLGQETQTDVQALWILLVVNRQCVYCWFGLSCL